MNTYINTQTKFMDGFTFKPVKVADCKGVIVGFLNDIMLPDDKVHWCPLKCRWVTMPELKYIKFNDMPDGSNNVINAKPFQIDNEVALKTNFM